MIFSLMILNDTIIKFSPSFYLSLLGLLWVPDILSVCPLVIIPKIAGFCLRDCLLSCLLLVKWDYSESEPSEFSFFFLLLFAHLKHTCLLFFWYLFKKCEMLQELSLIHVQLSSSLSFAHSLCWRGFGLRPKVSRHTALIAVAVWIFSTISMIFFLNYPNNGRPEGAPMPPDLVSPAALCWLAQSHNFSLLFA